MMRSMFAGVSGLRSHQTKMDVVGNNIANVNTAGFKRSTVTFSETLNQTIRGASAPSTEFFGGTNPLQVGLGVGVGSIDVVHSPGSPQATGRSLDMSIEGEGYFIIGVAADNNYTRAGNFGFDSQNNLVASNGMKVKGWTAAVDANNTFSMDTSQPISAINLTSLASTQIMQATSKASIALNLDSRSQPTGKNTPGMAGFTFDPAVGTPGNLVLRIDGNPQDVIVNIVATDTATTAAEKINSTLNAFYGTSNISYASSAGSNIRIQSGINGADSSVDIVTGSAGVSGAIPPANSAATLTVGFNAANIPAGGGYLQLSIDGVNYPILLAATDDINDVTSKINVAMNSHYNPTTTQIYATATAPDIEIVSGTIGPNSSIGVSGAGFAVSGLAYGRGVLAGGGEAFATQPKIYTSPTVKGVNMNNASPSNPVVIRVGEGVLFDEDFIITDGTKRVGYTYLKDLKEANPDAWEFDPSSGRLTIRDTLGAGWSANEPISANYKKAEYQTSMKIYDNQGGSHDFTVTFLKTGPNLWNANYAINGDLIQINNSFTRPIEFKPNGQIEESPAENALFNISHNFPATLGLDPLTIQVNLTNMIQVANNNSTLSLQQNGFEPGSLQRVSVNQTGQIIGTFSNGENLELAQVAVATFSNTSGLNKAGDTLFTESRNSGIPEIGTPGSGGRGNIKPESLEMSNVDLSQEFVDMIITQRGFQANSRIITTSDELLQELVNLKR